MRRTWTWLGILAIGSLLIAVCFGMVQQSIRAQANIPALELSTKLTHQILQTGNVAQVLQDGHDRGINYLEPGIAGEPTALVMNFAGTDLVVSTFDNWPSSVPLPPSGLFDASNQFAGDTTSSVAVGAIDTVTWQPRDGLRFATIIQPLRVDGHIFFLVTFGNLAPYEHQTDLVFRVACVGEVMLVLLCLFLAVFSNLGSSRRLVP